MKFDTQLPFSKIIRIKFYTKYLHFILLGNYEFCEIRFSAYHTLLRAVNKNVSDTSIFLTYLNQIWHKKYQ